MSEQLSELDKVQAEAKELGRTLGLLLSASPMPDEQKEAWLALIPEMNPQQLADFASALQQQVTDAEEQGFAELAKKLQSARENFGDRVTSATAAANDELSALENELI